MTCRKPERTMDKCRKRSRSSIPIEVIGVPAQLCPGPAPTREIPGVFSRSSLPCFFSRSHPVSSLRRSRSSPAQQTGHTVYQTYRRSTVHPSLIISKIIFHRPWSCFYYNLPCVILLLPPSSQSFPQSLSAYGTLVTLL